MTDPSVDIPGANENGTMFKGGVFVEAVLP